MAVTKTLDRYGATLNMLLKHISERLGTPAGLAPPTLGDQWLFMDLINSGHAAIGRIDVIEFPSHSSSGCRVQLPILIGSIHEMGAPHDGGRIVMYGRNGLPQVRLVIDRYLDSDLADQVESVLQLYRSLCELSNSWKTSSFEAVRREYLAVSWLD